MQVQDVVLTSGVSAGKTKKTIFLTMITTYGIKANEHSTGYVQAEVRMKDLFV